MSSILSLWGRRVKKLPTPIADNTHEVNVYYNGSLTPLTFQTILGNQNEFGTGSHLGMGLSSGTRAGAYDIDFFAYKEGVFVPQLPGLAGDYNDDNMVDAADYVVWRDKLGQSLALPNETVTIGTVTSEDYGAWRANFGAVGGGSGSAAAGLAVPEPNSMLLIFLALVSMVGRPSPTKRIRNPSR